ncbi:necrosis and ethylene-inducing protein [Colletotrichum cereale]|nr:necrosis and ethylene-inducing protein [Colletotrichum cereale]
MLVGKLLPFLGLLRAALSTPVDRLLERRGKVDHDSLSPSPQTVQDNPNGRAIARFNPLLHIAQGCQPYTVVDDAGDTSGGLKPSGLSDGDCEDTSKGQTYARGTQHKGKYAIMYAWYFPKDMPNDEVSKGAHRHDWESVVIWLSDPSGQNSTKLGGAGPSFQNTTILGGAASGHGEFKPTDKPPHEGDRVKVEYFSDLILNHELQFTATAGRTYPVLDWDVMGTTIQNALSNTDFGKADVPFIDKNFLKNLDKASI